MLIGAAVASAALCSEPAYHETLTGQFNALTPENAMKFGPLCSSQGNHDFGEADAIVAVAEEHGMKVRGHTLVWYSQTPGTGFFREGYASRGARLTKEKMTSRLENYIKEVIRLIHEGWPGVLLA